MKALWSSMTAGLTLGRVITLVFGVALIVRCERDPILPGGWSGCWAAGGGVLGIKGMSEAVGKGRFTEGLWTYNPALKRPKDEEEEPR